MENLKINVSEGITIEEILETEIDNNVELGHYGEMRRKYLEENHWEYYQSVVASKRFDIFTKADKRSSELWDTLFQEKIDELSDKDEAKRVVDEIVINEVVTCEIEEIELLSSDEEIQKTIDEIF